jgi:sugar O-acyltransferase (sialic acid O-acetyltransferase NeuD family)
MENPVIILGAQTVGTAALDAFTSNEVVVYCLLDDDAKLQNTDIHNIPVMGGTEDEEFLKLLGKKCEVFVATEDAVSRRALTNMLRQEYEQVPVNAIHKAASVSEHAWLGHGNLVSAGAVLASDCKVGNGCLIGARAVVDSKAEVGDFVQVGAGAVINSEAVVEEQAFIGSGAIIVSGVKIGAKARVGAGAVVIANVPAGQTVFGNPAQKV